MALSEERPSLSVADALEIIKKYLPVEWSKAREDQVTVNLITGGYVNTVHLVTRSNESIAEPQQVIVHRTGGGVPVDRKSKANFASRLDELMVFYASARLGCAPRLYGMSERLTVQEYFKCHTLKPQETLDRQVIRKLAQAYARFHSLDVPISRKKYLACIDMNKTRVAHLTQAKEQIKNIVSAAQPSFNWDQVFQLDFASEYEWLLKVCDKIGFRRVLITGDNNYLNVLVGEDDDDRIFLIDYEMTRYDVRGLDLGGHFVNRTIKWNDKVNKASGFDILDRQMRSDFLEEYSREIAASSAHSLRPPFDPHGLDSVTHLMQEVDIGMLSYALSWGFGILSSSDRIVEYENASFCTVCHHLISLYIKLKEQFVQENVSWQEAGETSIWCDAIISPLQINRHSYSPPPVSLSSRLG